MQKWAYSMGYLNIQEFFLRFVVPIMAGTLGAYFILFFFEVPWWLPYMFLIIGAGFVFVYPLLQYEKKKVDIHENIHLFITYAGTISTLDVNRAQFFRHVATQKQFGNIADIANKILYLSKKWNLGFAHTCRKAAKFSPSTIFADFLDRLAAVLDFGENLQVFLLEEQNAVMNDYETEYKQSLENIKTLQDVFISLTIAMAFALSAALLLPLLLGMDMLLVVQYGLAGLLFIDLLLILLIKVFIPSDKLTSKLKLKDEGSKRITRFIMLASPLALIIFAMLTVVNVMSFLMNFTVATFPLFAVGVLAIQEENKVFKRDKAYPSLIRAVGGTIYVRGGGVVSALGALQVHDFGLLQPMMTNLYRRLRLGSDIVQSWLYFSAETGSNLIYYFTEIFRESIYLGGHGEKIGRIISENFSRLLGLRKLRLQLASSMRGALYGGLVGFVTTVYMATTITDLLSDLFAGALGDEQVAGSASQLFSQILPQVPPVDIAMIGLYIGLMVIAHSGASAFIIKMIDGGKKEAMFFDFSVMLVIGSALSWIIPKISMWAFGSLVTGTPPA